MENTGKRIETFNNYLKLTGFEVNLVFGIKNILDQINKVCHELQKLEVQEYT